MSTIIKTGEKRVVIAIKGYALESDTDKKRKYSGKFDSIMIKLDWSSCAQALQAIEQRFRESFSLRDKIQFESDGLSGPYSAISRRLHGGVELTLSYASDNHLASGGPVRRSLYPGNHGQAIRHMVVQDLIEHAKIHGPFESEKDTLKVIEARTELHFNAVKNAKPAAYTVDKESIDDSDDAE